jgi:hypothetical protein
MNFEFSLYAPHFAFIKKTENIIMGETTETSISLPTKIEIINTNFTTSIVFRVLGFGFGLFIRVKT